MINFIDKWIKKYHDNIVRYIPGKDHIDIGVSDGST